MKITECYQKKLILITYNKKNIFAIKNIIFENQPSILDLSGNANIFYNILYRDHYYIIFYHL